MPRERAMATTRDYARKEWLDPVCEVERDALDRGFRRGVLLTVAVFLATFVITDILARFVRHIIALVVG
jgi:hypothetical protein